MGKPIQKHTQEEFESNIRNKTNGEYEVVSEYLGMENPIKILHHKCGRTYDLNYAASVYYKDTLCCPECRFSYVDEDYPELAKNFKDQSKTHIVKSSKEVVELICPCCGEIVPMDVAHYIRAGHVRCHLCNDGFPYPEKYVANILKQLNVPFVSQFSPEWAGKYRYDFQFDWNNKQYILEVDGGMGHGYHDAYETDKYESLEVDILKEELAIDHGYLMLRIECNYENYNRSKYIQKNAEETLSSIFDLSSINWKQCNLYAAGSLFQTVIETYRNETIYTSEISEITGVKIRTIIKYLTEAMESGLIPKDLIHQSRVRRTNKNKGRKRPNRSKSVYCYEDALLFQSVPDANEYYSISSSGLNMAIRKYNGFYKGRHFVYADDLPQDFNYEPMYFPEPQNALPHMIAQYNLNDELEKVYFRKEELPPEFSIKNIIKKIVFHCI